jgi:hypothetical protein
MPRGIEELVGRRVKVFFDDGEWYPGTVATKTDCARQYYIQYDDDQPPVRHSIAIMDAEGGSADRRPLQFIPSTKCAALKQPRVTEPATVKRKRQKKSASAATPTKKTQEGQFEWEGGWQQHPRSFKDPAALAEARLLLQEPLVAARIKPLVEYTERLRIQTGKPIPDFDPLGGGTEARVLFLLEAPSGNASTRSAASDMICWNNNDTTAEIDYELKRDAGLDRTDYVIWNACPYYVGSATKLRAPSSNELADETRHIPELLRLLPRLRVVVTAGAKPKAAWDELWRAGGGEGAAVKAALGGRRCLAVIHARHPSMQVRRCGPLADAWPPTTNRSPPRERRAAHHQPH